MTMTLAAWLKKHEMTQQEFSKLSGIEQPLVSRYVTGKGHPKAENILAIEKATHGEVALEDWARSQRSAA